MSKLTLLAGAALVLSLAGCMENGVDANCALMGGVVGAGLGAVTENNIAQSAAIGAVGGAVAADQGMCH